MNVQQEAIDPYQDDWQSVIADVAAVEANTIDSQESFTEPEGPTKRSEIQSEDVGLQDFVSTVGSDRYDAAVKLINKTNSTTYYRCLCVSDPPIIYDDAFEEALDRHPSGADIRRMLKEVPSRKDFIRKGLLGKNVEETFNRRNNSDFHRASSFADVNFHFELTHFVPFGIDPPS